ncbi:MAG: hypothetical protein A4S09_14195 [Proteobacteria bacterium SG_bin7]|nr:MAG: hypothetical protein A4S09_14195 [Proteobacteria bacterium SG_bin7]
MQERQKSNLLKENSFLSQDAPVSLEPDKVLFENKIATCCEPEWLTTKEAAHYLRISEAYLRNLTSNGAIPFYKFGRNNRYNRAELKRLLLESPGGSNGL